MTSLEPITVTTHLHEEQRADAVALLQGYFAGPLDKGRGFEGGWWDTFDPSGTRSSSQARFTADDVLSASLLSADIHPTAIVQILFTRADGLAAKLGGLGADRELASLSAAEARDLEEQNRPLWSAVRDLHDVGATRTSKLLARKRPNLIPIYDSVIGDAVYGRSATVAQWQRMHAALTADGGRLQDHLLSLRGDAGLPEEVSALRVFDVIAWLDGSGKAQKILPRH